MYFKEIAYLMNETITLNSKNRPKTTYTPTLIYVNEKSIGQSEFYQSAAVGLKPTIKLETKLVNLDGITHVKYHDTLYKILRTYQVEDNIEITLTQTIIKNEVNSEQN